MFLTLSLFSCKTIVVKLDCNCEKETLKFKVGESVDYFSHPLPHRLKFNEEFIGTPNTLIQNTPYIIENK